MSKENNPHDLLKGFRQFLNSPDLQELKAMSHLNQSVLKKMLGSVEQINSSNSSITRLISSLHNSSSYALLERQALESRAWKQQVQDIISGLGILPQYDLAFQTHLEKISKFSAFSEIYLSR